MSHHFAGTIFVMFAALSLTACGVQTQVANSGETASVSEPEVFFPKLKSVTGSPTAQIGGEFFLDDKGCLRI